MSTLPFFKPAPQRKDLMIWYIYIPTWVVYGLPTGGTTTILRSGWTVLPDLGSSAAAAAMSNLFTSKQYMNEEIVFLSSVSGDKCDVWLLQLMWKLRTWCRSSLSGPRRVTVSPVFPSLSLRRLFVYCKPHCTALFVRLREPWWNQSPLTWKAALRWL